MAAHYSLTIGAGQSVTIKLRFTDVEPLVEWTLTHPWSALSLRPLMPNGSWRAGTNDFGAGFDGLFAARIKTLTNSTPRAFPMSFPQTRECHAPVLR